MLSKILLSLLSLVLFSCASSSSSYKKQNDLKFEKIKSSKQFRSAKEIPRFRNRRKFVAPGHLIAISHPSDEKLKGRYRIGTDSILRLPYGVRIRSKNKTFSELVKEIRKSYKKFFQKGANSVKVTLVYRDYYIEVRGSVKKPGRYIVKKNESLDRVINRAGGVSRNLNKELLAAEIRQQGMNYTINLDEFYKDINKSKAFTWTGSDTIFVRAIDDELSDSALPMITFLSGVNKPGKVLFKEGRDLFYYINKSGGTISNIKYDESYIVRRTANGLEKINFDITDMTEIPAIQKNDVIMLYTDHRTFWDKFLQRTGQVLGIFSSIAIILLL